MRQIDADLLQEVLENEIELSKRKGERGMTTGLRIAARRVKHAPAIEAVPLDRLGDFGKLFMDYKGCPRGAMGRAGNTPIEEEVLMMKPITDVDGGRWIPVNADALHELVKKYVSLRGGDPHDSAPEERCLATGGQCSKCTPGPCDHRRESHE